MNKSPVATAARKTIISLFLAFILTTGTINSIFSSSLSSSFMTEVHALSDYGLEDNYKSKYLSYLNSLTSLSSNNTFPFKFNPVPFNEIPLVVINSTYGQYKFGADFSLDFGDDTLIEQDISATSVPNMRLDKDDTTLSLQLQCDSNDICDISLAPEAVSIYLLDDAIQDIYIAENSFPILELGSNDCSILSIEECANFAFSIPNNIILDNYKIVVKMSFDEAEWIFINPIKISDFFIIIF